MVAHFPWPPAFASKPTITRNSAMTFTRLAVCVVGIYASFLSWALVQERLSTTAYDDPVGGKPRYFRSVVFLNTVQSAFSCLAAFTYLLIRRQTGQPITTALGLQPERSDSSSSASIIDELPSNGIGHHNRDFKKPSTTHHSTSKSLLMKCLQCALLHSFGSPFGFASLQHIDFPTMILGKSCKLVPVMLMNIVLYRRRFAWHKYCVVSLVTIGISLFMLYADHGEKKTLKGAKSNSVFGLILLLINLLIDGATNSTQDEIFSKFQISGSQLMFLMNAFATCLTSMALLISFPTIPIINPSTTTSNGNELMVAIGFIKTYPKVLRDILLFSATGSIGQLFIFETLAHFGSLTLVTITVTRKLFTMLLSVFVFNHTLTVGQWVGVFVVFSAIAFEAYIKMGHGRATRIVNEKSKARVKEM